MVSPQDSDKPVSRRVIDQIVKILIDLISEISESDEPEVKSPRDRAKRRILENSAKAAAARAGRRLAARRWGFTIQRLTCVLKYANIPACRTPSNTFIRKFLLRSDRGPQMFSQTMQGLRNFSWSTARTCAFRIRVRSEMASSNSGRRASRA